MTRLCELVDSSNPDTARAARVLRAYGPMQVSWASRQRVRSALASRRAAARWYLRHPLILGAAVVAAVLIFTRLDARRPPAPEGGAPATDGAAAPLVEHRAVSRPGDGPGGAASLQQVTPGAAQAAGAREGGGHGARAARSADSAAADVHGVSPVAAQPVAAGAEPAAGDPGNADDRRASAEARGGPSRPATAGTVPWAPADRALPPDGHGKLAAGVAAPSPAAAETPGADAHGANGTGGEPTLTAVGGGVTATVAPWPEPRQPPQLRSAPPRGERKRPPDDTNKPIPAGPGRQNFEPAYVGGPGPARDEGPITIAFEGQLDDADVHGTIELERPEGGSYSGEVAWRDPEGGTITTSIIGSTDADVDAGLDLDGDGQEDIIVAAEDCPPVYANTRQATVASAIAPPICVYLRRQQRK